MKALILDQYETSLYLTASLLVARGFEVTLAATSHQAFSDFLEQNFNLVIIRCSSDDLQTTELISSMRAIEWLDRRDPVKIVATTSKSDPQLQRLLKLHGASSCLQHPLTNDEIISTAVNSPR